MLLGISILAPLFGILLLYLPLLIHKYRSNRYSQHYAFVVSFASGIVSFTSGFLVLCLFANNTQNYQFIETWYYSSATGFKIDFGIDGISLWLYLLTLFLFPIGIYFTKDSISNSEDHSSARCRLFYASLLFLEFAILGVFLTMNLFTFYIFWELTVIPMVLLLGIWGGANRRYATVKFFIYTFSGSIALLAGIIFLSIFVADLNETSTNFAFNYLSYPSALHLGHIEYYLFWVFILSFLIKIPMFPLHTWLPHAHTEAPTVGSMILAGILLKLGTYGLLRFILVFFPTASLEYSLLMMSIGLVGIIYGAWMAWMQTDIKKLIAYSSISHMGYIIMGSFAGNIEGISGAYLQSINHGISTALLFLLVGMLYNKTHTRAIKDYSGLAQLSRLYAIFFFIATISSIGLPGTNGFVGEFLILLGSFLKNPLIGTIAILGVIFSAIYMLALYKNIFFAKPSPKLVKLNKTVSLQMSRREIVLAIPFIIAIFLFGLKPNLILDLSKKTLINIVPKKIIVNK